MRLDKFLCDVLDITRKQATRVIKSGEVIVNGQPELRGAMKLMADDQVYWQGRQLMQRGPVYIMLYKPEGFVCSHTDDFNQTAFVLLDEPNLKDLHFAGRLDVDTTGLVLITDDGKWSHRVTSPKHQCDKTYRVWLADPVQAEYAEKFQNGIRLNQERELTRPAQLEVMSDKEVRLIIHEGKYHQVKRMFAALGNKVVALHREKVGAIVLDEELEPGAYRYLTDEEIDSVWSSNE